MTCLLHSKHSAKYFKAMSYIELISKNWLKFYFEKFKKIRNTTISICITQNLQMYKIVCFFHFQIK